MAGYSGYAPATPPTAPGRLAPEAQQRTATAGSVCGLPGLALPAVKRETVRDFGDGPGQTWSCGTATGEGPGKAYATFSATRDPAVIAGIRRSKGFTGRGFDAIHTVSDCSGAPTYFTMDSGPRYTESLGAGGPSPRDLFAAFSKAAAAKLGCTGP
ncbi:hypothetical protein [Streptomyces sp. NPDC048442]|uniref:hypothetical protein n=1 Tax=Streptomyces sp. NPDC048442 TaxID=3154823 RepID=UPI00343C8EBA